MKTRDGAGFALETLAEAVAFGEMNGKHFDGGAAIEACAGGFVDFARACFFLAGGEGL